MDIRYVIIAHGAFLRTGDSPTRNVIDATFFKSKEEAQEIANAFSGAVAEITISLIGYRRV